MVSQLANDDINEDLEWTFVNFSVDQENLATMVEKKLENII